MQGVVPGDVGRHAVEEAHRENGQDRLSVERPGRAQRVVSLYPSSTQLPLGRPLSSAECGEPVRPPRILDSYCAGL